MEPDYAWNWVRRRNKKDAQVQRRVPSPSPWWKTQAKYNLNCEIKETEKKNDML